MFQEGRSVSYILSELKFNNEKYDLPPTNSHSLISNVLKGAGLISDKRSSAVSGGASWFAVYGLTQSIYDEISEIENGKKSGSIEEIKNILRSNNIKFSDSNEAKKKFDTLRSKKSRFDRDKQIADNAKELFNTKNEKTGRFYGLTDISRILGLPVSNVNRAVSRFPSTPEDHLKSILFRFWDKYSSFFNSLEELSVQDRLLKIARLVDENFEYQIEGLDKSDSEYIKRILRHKIDLRDAILRRRSRPTHFAPYGQEADFAAHSSDIEGSDSISLEDWQRKQIDRQPQTRTVSQKPELVRSFNWYNKHLKFS